MKSTFILFAVLVATPALAFQAGKGGYNQAALAGSQRSPVNVGRKLPPAPAPVQQVQQKFEEEEDESALLAAQRQRPRPQPPPAPAPAPAPVAPPAPRPAPAPYRPQPPPAPRPAPPAPRPAVLAPQRPRPAPPAPAPIEAEGPEPAPEPYSFSYSVNDEETGSALQREESQDANGNVVGFYHITDAEGRLRRVDYTAGPEGFKANIRSNEEGLAARDSADAHYDVSAPPAGAGRSGPKPGSAVAGNRY